MTFGAHRANSKGMEISLASGLTIYNLILAVHFLWAAVIIQKKWANLALGSGASTWGQFFAKPVVILGGLLVLNAPSMIVFIPQSGFATPTAAAGHGLYHILLAADEIMRTRRDPVRGVFLANHLYWAALLLSVYR